MRKAKRGEKNDTSAGDVQEKKFMFRRKNEGRFEPFSFLIRSRMLWSNGYQQKLYCSPNSKNFIWQGYHFSSTFLSSLSMTTRLMQIWCIFHTCNFFSTKGHYLVCPKCWQMTKIFGRKLDLDFCLAFFIIWKFSISVVWIFEILKLDKRITIPVF